METRVAFCASSREPKGTSGTRPRTQITLQRKEHKFHKKAQSTWTYGKPWNGVYTHFLPATGCDVFSLVNRLARTMLFEEHTYTKERDMKASAQRSKARK